jgi:signal transduction histidine kinase/CheY-like chemotaxis protein
MERDVELLARIIEHTPVGIVLLRPDRSIQYVNLLANHILRGDRDILLGVPIDQFVVDLDGETPWRELLSLAVEGKAGESKVGIIRSGTEEITCTLTAFSLVVRPGQEASVALVFRDVTHEQRITDQLEKKNVEMAKMNTELIRSNMALKRVSEMKSNFLSIASHELKTPLTSIKGYSDIIIDGMKDRVDPGIFRMIESINRAAGRLHKVIDNILDVTRIEQKKLRLKLEEFSLETLATDCIEEVSQFAAKRNIVFKKFFAPDLPLFTGDRMRMQQVFANLFTNAIKFSPDGSDIDVTIALADGDRFRIAVKDRGIGIDRNEQKNIFSSFYEVADINKHSTDHTKFMGGGTGLGLSIAKGIIERHGGSIRVESEGVKKGAFPGSTFHLLLPRVAELSADDMAKGMESGPVIKDDQSLLPSAQETSSQEKQSLLIIESDRETVEVARIILESVFDIIAAESGELGLSLAFQYKPSVVLVDTFLPGLDGIRICKILKSQDETRDTAVIFMSSDTGREGIEKCFECGADDFIVKPFSNKELMDKIWRVLMKKKSAQAK